MGLDEWPDFVPLIQSALNCSPSTHRPNVAPFTAFTGMESTPQVSTFIRFNSVDPVALTSAQKEQLLNITTLKDRMMELQPILSNSVQAN